MKKNRHITQYSASQDTQQRLLQQVENRITHRELARTHRYAQHRKGDDGALRVVERGLAHHRLHDALLDPDLIEHRHQCRRVGGGKHGAEQQRNNGGHAKEIPGRRTGDRGGDQHAEGGDHHDVDPHLFQHLEAYRRAAVKQDIAGTENQDQLVDGGVGLDVYQPQYAGAEQHAHQQEHYTSGIRASRAISPEKVPTARMTPNISRMCLANSSEAEDSIAGFQLVCKVSLRVFIWHMQLYQKRSHSLLRTAFAIFIATNSICSVPAANIEMSTGRDLVKPCRLRQSAGWRGCAKGSTGLVICALLKR